MNGRKNVVIAVLATICLMSAVFALRAYGAYWPYDPWWDITDDGKVDIADLARVSGAFGTTGQKTNKSQVLYDSGWINITDMQGESITLEHNLGIADWNDPKLMVDITGKTSPEDATLQRQLGLTEEMGWNKSYIGAGLEDARALVQTDDGGYILAGAKLSFPIIDADLWLVKTDAEGNMQWNKTYGGTSPDLILALVQTGDSGYALAGATYSFGAGSDDFWLVKTDANGNMLWNKTYGGTNDDRAQDLVIASNGGYALAGYTDSFGAGGYDFWLVKTDADGNMLWNKTYGGTNTDQAYSVVQTGDGGYALAGYTNSFGAGDWDVCLVKTDADGNMQWNKTYGGTNREGASDLVVSSDGGYALGGYTGPSGYGTYDFWLVKTDADGDMQWNKTYVGGTEHDIAQALVQTADDGYALAGETASLGAGGYDFWLVKTDSAGNMQWNKTYGGTEHDQPFDLVPTNDGGYALAGCTQSFGDGGDFWLVKTDADGNMQLGAGLVWTDCSANTITLYRNLPDADWNYVRVRISRAK